MRAVVLFIFMLTAISLSPPASAGGVATLVFHMGLGANGQYFVGGTIRNTGDGAINRGYVVLLPVTERCYPMSFVSYEFGDIPPGGERAFRIPVGGQLASYRLAGMGAVDDMGYALPVRDDTKAILDARRAKDTHECLIKREGQ
jgi:hypothetical protein